VRVLNAANLTAEEMANLLAKELNRRFSSSELDSLARKTGFVQRSGKCTPQDFVSLCVFSTQSVATDSLVHLCNHLDAENKLFLSAEGLNQRFNPAAVDFLKRLFSSLLRDKIGRQSAILSQVGDLFRRIRLLDSTVFQLPDEYADPYLGSGGSAHTAGMKIQLEYELKSGDFLQVEVGPGKNNDGSYGTKRAFTVESGDLCIRDLGYFCIEDFETMQKQGAFYVSRLKLNVRIYEKNLTTRRFQNGNVRKDSLYQEVDLEAIMDSLKPGESKEMYPVYIGKKQRFPTRLVVYKLTPEQTEKRLKTRATNEKKKNITYLDRTKRLSGISIFITNIPVENTSKEQIHELYSLRWQIEVLFKTWKSMFHIDHCKHIKIPRFECHVYGQLIAIFLSSSLMFQMRCFLLEKKKKEVSEYKGIGIIRDHLGALNRSLRHTTRAVRNLLLRLVQRMERAGCKSHRYEKKTVFDILGVAYEQHRQKDKAA
jgi:hypothetical protein